MTWLWRGMFSSVPQEPSRQQVRILYFILAFCRWEVHRILCLTTCLKENGFCGYFACECGPPNHRDIDVRIAFARLQLDRDLVAVQGTVHVLLAMAKCRLPAHYDFQCLLQYSFT